MQNEGNILKMRTELSDPVNYFLPIGTDQIEMNKLIGKEISMVGSIVFRVGKKPKHRLTKDSVTAAYKPHPKPVNLLSDQSFRNHIWELHEIWNGRKNMI